LDRKVLKVVLPIIIGDWDWDLPKQLSTREHMPTTTAARKHLRNHPSSDSITNDLDLLAGAAKIVSSVTNDVDTEGEVTVAGVVNAVLRFQGIMMKDNSMQQVTAPTHSCAQRLLGALFDCCILMVRNLL
jgi:hypothetical protein